jgi:hypothetical protein
MDAAWSGGVQYGGTGGACARPGTLAQESGAAFPLNRECTLFGGANSNAPLTNPTRTRPLTGGAGENGAPIGAETSLAQRAGGLDGQPDACRADAAGTNPCALPIGAAPAVAFALAFSGASPAAFAEASALTASARHPRALVPGDTLTLALPGVTRDGGDLASTGTDLTVTVAGAGAAGWTMAWDAGAAALALIVATPVAAHATLLVEVAADAGLRTPATTAAPDFAAAALARGARVSIVVRDGAPTASFSDAAGDPLAGYQIGSARLSMPPGALFRVRLTPYNGRFRGSAAATSAAARAVLPPAPPAYFAQVGQGAVGAGLDFHPGTPGISTQVHPALLLAAGCWLLAAGCWLLAAGCWLLAACSPLVAVCCLLLQGRRASSRARPSRRGRRV